MKTPPPIRYKADSIWSKFVLLKNKLLYLVPFFKKTKIIFCILENTTVQSHTQEITSIFNQKKNDYKILLFFKFCLLQKFTSCYENILFFFKYHKVTPYCCTALSETCLAIHNGLQKMVLLEWRFIGKFTWIRARRGWILWIRRVSHQACTLPFFGAYNTTIDVVSSFWNKKIYEFVRDWSNVMSFKNTQKTTSMGLLYMMFPLPPINNWFSTPRSPTTLPLLAFSQYSVSLFICWPFSFALQKAREVLVQSST